MATAEEVVLAVRSKECQRKVTLDIQMPLRERKVSSVSAHNSNLPNIDTSVTDDTDDDSAFQDENLDLSTDNSGSGRCTPIRDRYDRICLSGRTLDIQDSRCSSRNTDKPKYQIQKENTDTQTFRKSKSSHSRPSHSGVISGEHCEEKLQPSICLTCDSSGSRDVIVPMKWNPDISIISRDGDTAQFPHYDFTLFEDISVTLPAQTQKRKADSSSSPGYKRHQVRTVYDRPCDTKLAVTSSQRCDKLEVTSSQMSSGYRSGEENRDSGDSLQPLCHSEAALTSPGSGWDTTVSTLQ